MAQPASPALSPRVQAALYYARKRRRARQAEQANAPWSPSHLGSALIAWWDAEHSSSLSLSGSQVTSWRDRVTAKEAYQEIGGSRPVYSATSYNDRPGLTFDGIDDFLEIYPEVEGGSIGGFPIGAEPGEIWALVNQPVAGTTAGTRRPFGYAGGANTTRNLSRVQLANVNRARLSVADGATTQVSTNTAVDFSGNCVVRGVVTGTQMRTAVNGNASADTAVVPASAATYATISSNSGVNLFWLGTINSVILTKPLTEEQAADLLDYLKARGGIA